MSQDLRSTDRKPIHEREEWITKFVNTVVREMQLGLDRMAVVAAARDAWLRVPGTMPREAARDWAVGLNAHSDAARPPS